MTDRPIDSFAKDEDEEDADLLDDLFPEDSRLSRETEHRQYGKERGTP